MQIAVMIRVSGEESRPAATIYVNRRLAQAHLFNRQVVTLQLPRRKGRKAEPEIHE